MIMIKKIYTCDCDDWKENMKIIDDYVIFHYNHFGVGYEGKKFEYCPWCGKKLLEYLEDEDDGKRRT